MKFRRLVIVRTLICATFLAVLMGFVLSPTPLHAASCDINYFKSLNLQNRAFDCVSPRQCKATPQTNPINHCEVVGYINPRVSPVDGKDYAIGFHLRLPDNWNGRFYFQGGSGNDGQLFDALGGGALAQGYAVVSSDGGHDATNTGGVNYDANAGGSAEFGLDPQARLDFGYNTIDQVTQTAKYLITTYYNRAIDYSYFVGCSNGGRQAMVASQRFPAYFDGIVAGSPGFNLPNTCGAYNQQALAPLATRLTDSAQQPYLPDTFSDGDLTLVANAILKACDSFDSLIDGIVDNYAACTDHVVYPELDALRCAGVKSASCLSSGQIAALKKIYAGPKNSKGKSLYVDRQWDPGNFTPNNGLGMRMWNLGNLPTPPSTSYVNNAIGMGLGGGSLPLIFMTPPDIVPLNKNEEYIFNYNWDTDYPGIYQTSGIYTQASMEFMTAHATDLSPFKHSGGKMIIYHGNSDPAFSPHDTLNWYRDMNAKMRNRAQDFIRLFMVPGMVHCGGGQATSSFDAFKAIVNWVEHGTAPDSILATAPAPAPGRPASSPWPGRTRPLCPYPEVTRYLGTGSIDDAANFTCVKTEKARVEIEPGKLSLGNGKPYFTAFIDLPHQGDWRAISAVCEGAPAVKLARRSHGYTATFKKADLKNVTPTEKMAFTATLFVEHQGHHCGNVNRTPVAFEGTDIIKIME
jgi:hypothetical protein